MNYICDDCGNVFNSDNAIIEKEDVQAYIRCPYCSSLYYSDAVKCEICGELYKAENGYCDGCVTAIAEFTSEFIEQVKTYFKINYKEAVEFITAEMEKRQ